MRRRSPSPQGAPQILRDRRTLVILVGVPALFLLLYGYALNFDIRNIALAVETIATAAGEPRVVSAFVNSGYFDLVARRHRHAAEIERLIDRNEAAPCWSSRGFGRDVVAGRRRRCR